MGLIWYGHVVRIVAGCLVAYVRYPKRRLLPARGMGDEFAWISLSPHISILDSRRVPFAQL